MLDVLYRDRWPVARHNASRSLVRATRLSSVAGAILRRLDPDGSRTAALDRVAGRAAPGSTLAAADLAIRVRASVCGRTNGVWRRRRGGLDNWPTSPRR